VPELLAAGGLLWRPDRDGAPETAVVHRPRYDDWSLPKGKRDGEESLAATAVREIAEETGYAAVLGPRLPATRYHVPEGPKTVHYWAARCAGGTFTPNHEVDDLRWVGLTEAKELLTYPHDRMVADRLDGAAAVDASVLLVRHAKAGKREQWPGPDDLRPLSRSGWRQAEALRGLLALFGPRRVHCAPRTRCRQSVEGLAADLGVDVVDEPLLSEEGYWVDPPAGRRRLAALIREGGGPAVVCSQGGVIPDLMGALLGPERPADHELRSRKASVWVLSFADGDARRLVAADYYPDPFR